MRPREVLRIAKGDLMQFPSLLDEEKVNSGEVITLGDLHGNALKLIYLLLRHQFITMRSDEYVDLIRIYQTPVKYLTTAQLNLFDLTIDNAFAPENFSANQVGMIRFLGDLLSDRGSNDYFTIAILRKLSAHGMIKEIIASNHDHTFIENLFFSYGRYSIYQQQKSYDNLHRLMKRDLGIQKAEMEAFIRHDYKSHLKLIGVARDTKEIIFYTHAPTLNIHRIITAAAELGIDEPKIDEDKVNMDDLCCLIDSINILFAESFVRGDYFVHGQSFPQLLSLMFDRIDDRGEPIPAQLEGLEVRYYHGHDIVDYPDEESYIHGLDDFFGKGSGSAVGNYYICISPNC